jgi:hypothetical protein
MAKLENVLQALYANFSNSPKQHLESNKLVEIMETKGFKIL